VQRGKYFLASRAHTQIANIFLHFAYCRSMFLYSMAAVFLCCPSPSEVVAKPDDALRPGAGRAKWAAALQKNGKAVLSRHIFVRLPCFEINIRDGKM
jgi:hypothetical protein